MYKSSTGPEEPGDKFRGNKKSHETGFEEMKKSHATGFEKMKKGHAALSVDLNHLKVDRVVLSVAKPQGKREKEELLKSGIVLDPKQTQELNAEEGIVKISEWFEDETPDLQDIKAIGCPTSYNKLKWLSIREVERHKL